MNLLAINWNVNPEIFSLGQISVRWYGLLFALSFLFGYYIMKRFFVKENISQKVLDSLSTYMFVGTILGARLGHCLFYQPNYYLSHPIDIFKIWEGGLASHGAAVGIIIAIWIFHIRHKKSFLWTIDRIVIVVALSAVFIRTGNLMNSEIYGNATSLPWGFIFHRDGQSVAKHPTQIYEALWYLISFLFLLWHYYKKDGKPRNGFLFGMFLILIFASRFFIEFLKEPQVGFEENMFLNMGQLLTIPFVIVGFLLVRASTNYAK